uniref:Clan AA aspartic protease, AF_0612 family n=1 Tax=Candidatus Kentrum sp. MB TaxID=2138164 RepID=A0A450XYL1_9GAMM|nr:MAG: clan AA aspartic protease, AF_0612 family [Candidatus Kentron sp. MB]VFK34380.1 MAG: clan AA aspartic protease, AF_0612 family [Candidatus Kentron sp. MB]VFK76485.1 MAG: clan AA aspartic protease, AF_0612 family [Candidatus Kentron sp. MB]
MGLTYTNLILENTFRERRISVRALVDSGAVFMIIPEHMALELGFDIEEFSTREVILADGLRKRVPMVGPLRVRFGDRHCDLSALVLGDEPLMGVVPMEMMDLVLYPATHSITINPESPYVPTARLPMVQAK